MTDFDDKIRAALSGSDQKLYDSLSEPSLLEMVAETFSGRLKWLTVLATIMMAVYTAVGFYCGYRFFHAIEVQAMIGWATGFLVCVFIALVMKLWTWMQMDRLTLVRELKRLELQVAALSAE